MKYPTNKTEGGIMNTIIGKDTVFTGTLDVKGAIRVDGTVKGKVICTDTVTVGTTGYVEADLEGQIVVVAGKVVGNLTATEKLELQAKSDVEGDLKTKSLVVEQGAIFCGSCKMKGNQKDLGFLPPEEKNNFNKPLDDKEKEKSKFKI